MKSRGEWMFVTFLLAMMAGCQSLAPPNWGHPGTAETQQKRAEQFDPYPENDIGPMIVGARPLDYQSPRPEVQRARWFLWNPWQR